MSQFTVLARTSGPITDEWATEVLILLSQYGPITSARRDSTQLRVTYSTATAAVLSLRAPTEVCGQSLQLLPLTDLPLLDQIANLPPERYRLLFATDKPNLPTNLLRKSYRFYFRSHIALYLEVTNSHAVSLISRGPTKGTLLLDHLNTIHVTLFNDHPDFHALVTTFVSFGSIQEVSKLTPISGNEFVMTIVYADEFGFHRSMKHKFPPEIQVRPLLDGEQKCEKATLKIPHYFPPDIIAEFSLERPLFGICARCESNLFTVSSSSVKYGRPENVFLSEKPLFFSTKDVSDSWIEICFETRHLYLTGIVLKSCPFEKDECHPRGFKIEGSSDGQNYFVLGEVEDCVELNLPGGSGMFCAV
jgi:hypothetical protein